MEPRNAMLLVEAQRAIEALEMNVRRLWVETLATGGTLPDPHGRLAEIRDALGEVERALPLLVEHSLSAEVRELRTLARAEGLLEEEAVEEFVVARLEARGAEDEALVAAVAAGDGRARVTPLRA